MDPNQTRTKFIATLGPKSINPETMEGLVRAGLNMFRCNFVHTTFDQYRYIRGIVNDINSRLGTNVKIQADLQGLSIRLGDLPDGQFFLKGGEEYVFATTGGHIEDGQIPINDDMVHTCVQPGQDISFMNGALEGEIVGVVDNRLYVKMINSGMLRQHKQVNLPETTFKTGLTEKDYADIDFLLEEGVDWFALSFVTTKEEIQEIRNKIGDRPVKIMSKIERKQAVDNITDIVEASDAIMVARGDLGIEVPQQDVPIIQRDIMAVAHHYKKPVVVATQMLLSMVHAKRPTRAEVSDVATAIFERSDAVMLSEETAEGEDPINALSTMVSIVKRIEEYMYTEPNFFNRFW